MTNLNDDMLAIVRQAAAAEQRAASKLLKTMALDESCFTIHADAMNRLGATLEASPLAPLRECRAGCSMCCLTVSVDVTGLEALVIADHVRLKLSPERHDEILERLRKSTERRNQMGNQQRKNLRMACAFLDRDGLCSIYESRPLVCAGVYSLSQSACEDAYQADELVMQQVPLDQPAKLATMGTSAGLQRALVGAGLDGNLYELHSATFTALTTADAAKRYFAGDDLFADCICTDAHSPPRVAPVVDSLRHDRSPVVIEFKSPSKAKRKKRQKLLERKRRRA